MDVCFVVAVVAGVDAYSFAEEFFDDWGEGGGAVGEIQAVEGEVGGLKGAG